ncbi:acyl-CoA ligase FadD12 [Mycolicibacter hiberniae]|uniref:Long-chain-fatty-acid--CoA ligase FadD13 n=1 Tax=Mycolicibacter hiberniae TaxID=29314 RepID=A0A7I7X7P6_9MYCO|nr:acyl-CoA ligase FadD12 [Mycolicibacter hiberniae]MCV7087576.1 bile acid CoA ligase [Mycolicibacter hiberniae]ORV72332.1 acyl-CoA synthetase [Mycolicibacter hiberniae]BBZ24903.1 acyl-CoA synthetase [Mycolicibacter hiberniae]
MAPLDSLNRVGSMLATFTRVGLLAPMRPDKYVRIAAAAVREGGTTTTGIAMAAQRCGDRPAVIDERGMCTYAELDRRCDALAVGLRGLGGQPPRAVALMCRNHRGFIEALAAANRIGADVLLLNTSFAGPALAEVVARENVDLIVYDEEFTPAVDLAVPADSGCTRVVSWADGAIAGLTTDELIDANAGRRPAKPSRSGKLVMLTSGTTGTPKGARRSGRGGGGVADLQAIFDRIPWHTEEAVVIAAPMFHAWGFSQLALALTMACTIVTRRKFDPEATLALIERHQATGLCVVPVMFDRIMALPDEVRAQYPCRSLRFATASGSRMRPDVVTAFMDAFGDVVYNNYNATEAGMIALATPQDLRHCPDTAGRPAPGTEIRILDGELAEIPPGSTGQIFVRNSSQFDGYTGGESKMFHDGFMASGDLGYIDDAGRLFVVGRDDEMIVSGGENVYPIETEKALTNHPAVAEAAVLGVDDAEYGQRLVAFVVLEPGAAASVEELKQHVRDNLAGYKVPRAITIMDALPRNNTGKVVRRELQALAAD